MDNREIYEIWGDDFRYDGGQWDYSDSVLVGEKCHSLRLGAKVCGYDAWQLGEDKTVGATNGI